MVAQMMWWCYIAYCAIVQEDLLVEPKNKYIALVAAIKMMQTSMINKTFSWESVDCFQWTEEIKTANAKKIDTID